MTTTVISGLCPGGAWGDTCRSCRLRQGYACKLPSAACPASARRSPRMVCPAHVTGNVRQQRTPDLCFYTCAPCFYGLLHIYNFKYGLQVLQCPEAAQQVPLSSSCGLETECCFCPCQPCHAGWGAHPSHVPLQHARRNAVAWPASMRCIA